MEACWLAIPGFVIWLVILMLPWRPWSTRESLDGQPSLSMPLDDVTVLIPARNEAAVIARTLHSVALQGHGQRIILIDDQSTDDTIVEARNTGLNNLDVLRGAPMPDDWTGKLWALEQGRRRVESDYILLLDADIELLPGTLPALLNKLVTERYGMVSLMAFLRMESFWEKLLMPAFIYFFKLLYPFHLSNTGSKYVAAAAGGCILIESRILNDIGGFESLKEALIDDCMLARRVRDHGAGTWIGLTRSAKSHRRYDNFAVIRDMVARTAYTQLHYSVLLLTVCTLLMIAAFLLPIVAFFSLNPVSMPLALATFLIMGVTYVPTLKYYGLNPAWAAALPVTGLLYLLMTWNSAFRHWRGISAVWKNRTYRRQA
ncbi:MAG: glycosyltransferase [Gammaproteobacteria bacterium]